jgi:hypothetical protein
MKRLLPVLAVATLAIAGCGSSAKSGGGSSDSPPKDSLQGSQVGAFGGYDISQFTLPDGRTCVMAETNNSDWSVGLSCDPTSTTLPTPTGTPGGF